MAAVELAGGERLEYDAVPYDLIVLNRDGVFFGTWACPICATHDSALEAALSVNEANGFARNSLAFHHTELHAKETVLEEIPWAFVP
jgi:hypothetical protein